EDRDVGAPLALQFELRAFKAGADFVIGNAEVDRGWPARWIGKTGELLVAERFELLGRGGVMTVAIDNHRKGTCELRRTLCLRPARAASQARRLRLRGRRHSGSSVTRRSNAEARRRRLSTSRGASERCGESSSAMISQSRLSAAVTQRPGAKRASANGF